jgi:hypothetical protein
VFLSVIFLKMLSGGPQEIHWICQFSDSPIFT